MNSLASRPIISTMEFCPVPPLGPPMQPRFCKQCMSTELRPSQFRLLEYGLLLVGMRPLRCKHCFRRQYAVVNPLVVLLVAACRKVDATVNLIHPEVREEHLSRRKRRRRRATRRAGASE